MLGFHSQENVEGVQEVTRRHSTFFAYPLFGMQNRSLFSTVPTLSTLEERAARAGWLCALSGNRVLGDKSPPLDVAHLSSFGCIGSSAATSCALPWSLDQGSHPSPASGRHGAQGSGSGEPTRPQEERGALSWACWGRPCGFEGNYSDNEITCGIMRNYAQCHRAVVSDLGVRPRLDSGGAGRREH